MKIGKWKESFDRGFLIRLLVIIVGLAAFIMLLARLNNIEKTQMVSTSGYSYETAVVTQVVTDNLTESGERVGYQKLRIKLTSGTNKDTEIDATSGDGHLYGAICAVGDKVVVTLSVSGNSTNASIYSQDRTFQVFAFVGIFLLLICLIGGKNGVKSVVGLIFTFVSIVYLYMPLVYTGTSPFWAAILIAVLTTIVTMYLIGGASVKTFCSITGTTIGVLLAGLSAWGFGLAADIDGYNVTNIESLVYVGQNTNVQIGGLLFSGILIASLGAVMDVAMSVSSAINEIHDKSPQLTWMELFKSGMNVGRDMMGTMSNTLILAFVGGSLSTLVVDYVYNLPFLQLVNSYGIGIEVMQGVAGSIGVILTVPSVALITSVLLKRKNVRASLLEP